MESVEPNGNGHRVVKVAQTLPPATETRLRRDHGLFGVDFVKMFSGPRSIYVEANGIGHGSFVTLRGQQVLCCEDEKAGISGRSESFLNAR